MDDLETLTSLVLSYFMLCLNFAMFSNSLAPDTLVFCFSYGPTVSACSNCCLPFEEINELFYDYLIFTGDDMFPFYLLFVILD